MILRVYVGGGGRVLVKKNRVAVVCLWRTAAVPYRAVAQIKLAKGALDSIIIVAVVARVSCCLRWRCVATRGLV